HRTHRNRNAAFSVCSVSSVANVFSVAQLAEALRRRAGPALEGPPEARLLRIAEHGGDVVERQPLLLEVAAREIHALPLEDVREAQARVAEVRLQRAHRHAQLPRAVLDRAVPGGERAAHVVLHALDQRLARGVAHALEIPAEQLEEQA